MKHRMNKIICLFIATVFLFSAFPAFSFFTMYAAENTVENAEEPKGVLPEKSPAYRYLHEALRSAPESVDLREYQLSTAEFREMATKLTREPDLFFAKGWSFSYSGDKVIRAQFKYSYPSEDLPSIIEEFNMLAEELYRLADPDWNDLEIALFYHDYFASGFCYDESKTLRNCYEFLKHKTGVCQAYSAAYQLALQHFGIPVTYVRSDNLNHRWNAVYLDGGWYVVDVTHDDPRYDRPGRVQHKHFLISLDEYFEQEGNESGREDYEVGEEILFSSESHPLTDFFKSSDTSFAQVMGNAYGIIRKADDQYYLCQVDVNTGTVLKTVQSLPSRWSIPGGNRYYRHNCSQLCCYKGYLYFNDECNVYMFDPRTEKVTRLDGCDSSTRIYGLSIENGCLVMHTTPEANVSSYIPVQLQHTLPAYYTIRWQVGEETLKSYLPEGAIPSFPGIDPPELPGFVFAGWSSELLPAKENVTYSALFTPVLLYIPGDVDHSGEVNISDVTALLNYLADPSYPVDLHAVDPDGSGVSDITDVTLLLNYLAGADVLLN